MMFEAGSGPIPGENYTSDTKNYPWHQPPEFTDIDKALDMMSEKITNKKVANSLLTMIEIGIPVYKVASMLITAGMMNGKWTLDFGLLLVGPITRILELLCIGYGVEYNLGIEDDEEMVTGEFFKVLNEPRKVGDMEVINNGIEEVKQDASEGEPTEEGSDKEEPNLGSMGFMAQQTANGVNE